MPSVLSFEQWNHVRQLETERENQRLDLQAIKRQDRADFLVAYGGQPLKSQPADVQAALQPFAEAVAAAYKERQSQPRHVPPHRVPEVVAGTPTVAAVSTMSADQEDYQDERIELHEQ